MASATIAQPRLLAEAPASVPATHIPALDGVRGVAIAAVLIAHSAGPMLGRTAGLGALGVDLFFVLSGYLITGILLRSAGSTGYFRNFYARRFLRLFPVYYGWLIVLALVLPAVHMLAGTSMPDYKGNWLWYVAYLSNWKTNGGSGDPYLGQFWSLAVEEQFYLIWPAVVLLAGSKRLPWVCVAIIGGSLALRWSWWSEDAAITVYRNTFCRIDQMAIGALAVLGVPFRIAGLLCVPFALVLSVDCFSFEARTMGQLAASVSAAALVLWAAEKRDVGVLCAPMLRILGLYSYTAYVIHGAVFAHVAWLGAWARAPKWIIVLTENAATIALAAVIWRVFEEPLLRLKARFS